MEAMQRCTEGYGMGNHGVVARCVEAAQSICGGCVEGCRMVARCTEHIWGCMESTQRGIEWLLGAQRGPMEWLLGPWRVCGGHKEGGWRSIEWFLGV